MYQEVFNFHARPFTLAPYVKHYFPAGPIEQSLGQVGDAIARDAGPVVVVGAHGTGKSLMLALAAERYQDQFEVVNLACGPMEERRDLLQAILFELKQPYRDMSEGELRLSLVDFIKPNERCPNGVLLLVDDAQTLPADLVDELRLVTNFVRDGVPRVRLVIAGTTRLEEVLAEPKLEAFNQRISGRCYLAGLNRDETYDYIQAHVTRAGGDAEKMFCRETTNAIQEATSGNPRFINQLCEQAMIVAATHGMLVVEPQLVAIGWAEVQGLPSESPVLSPPAGESAVVESDDSEWTVIEFGSLDDDESDAAQESPEPVAENPTVEFEPFTSTEAEEEPAVAEVQNPQFDEPEPTAETTPVVETFVTEPTAPTSIPTEVQSLYDDQSAMWEAAGETVEPVVESEAISEPVFTAELAEDEVVEAPAEYSADALARAFGQPAAETTEADAGPPADEAFEANASPDPFSASPEIDAFGVVDETANATTDWQPEVQDADPTPIANPFEETFDSEEAVTDHFAGFVSQQNTASLQVTPSELEHLQPLPEVESSFTAPVAIELTTEEPTTSVPELNDFTSDEPPANDAGLVAAFASLEEPIAAEPVEQIEGNYEAFESPLIEPTSPLADFAQPATDDLDVPDAQLVTPEETANALQPVENQNADAQRLAALFASLNPAGSAESTLTEEPVAEEPTFEEPFAAAEDEASTGGYRVPMLEEETEEHNIDTDSTTDPYPLTSPLSGSGYHEHSSYSPSPEVQQKADEILQAIQFTQEPEVAEPATEPVSHETQTPALDETQPYPMVASVEAEDANAELTEAQQVLNEILEQKRLLSNVYPADAASAEPSAQYETDEPESLAMVHSLQQLAQASTPSAAVDDDRDMIVVTDLAEAQDENTPEVETQPQTPVSTGKAERMDYERLFEQLRNVNRET